MAESDWLLYSIFVLTGIIAMAFDMITMEQRD